MSSEEIEAIVQRDRAEFAERAARFRLRSPASTRGLIHGVARGTCLEPLATQMTEAWFDPALAPANGDLVLVEFSDEWMRRVQESVEQSSAEYRAAWLKSDSINGVMPHLGAKLFVLRAGRPFLLWKDGAFPLERVGKVVGVCRAIRSARARVLRSIVEGLLILVVGTAATAAAIMVFRN